MKHFEIYIIEINTHELSTTKHSNYMNNYDKQTTNTHRRRLDIIRITITIRRQHNDDDDTEHNNEYYGILKNTKNTHKRRN